MHVQPPGCLRRRRRAPIRGRFFPEITRFSLVLTALLIASAQPGCVQDNDSGEMPRLAQAPRRIEGPANIKLTADELPEGRKELTFAVTPYLPEDAMRAAFEPIAAHIGRKLGIRIRFRLARSYKDLIELASTGQVDIVQISPMSYVIAKRELPGLRLLGSSLSFGTDHYSSLIIGRASIGQDWMSNLLTKKEKYKFIFVDPRSGSGFLFPYAELLRMGVRPERDLNIVFSGSHDRSIEMIKKSPQEHEYVAAVSSGTLNAARTADVIGSGNLRILHKAARIPYDALCTTPGVSEEASIKIATAFGALNTMTATGRAALRQARGLTGWVKADDAQYNEVREKLKAVEPQAWHSRWQHDERKGVAKVPMFGAQQPEAATKAGN